MTHTRRDFLRSSLTMAGLAGLSAPSALQAQTLPDNTGTDEDYRAVICIFLNGGNDHNNTIVPLDADSYAAYKRFRPDLYIHLDELKIGANEVYADAQGRLMASLHGQNTLPLRAMPMDNFSLIDTSQTAEGRQFGMAPALTPLYPKYLSGELAVLLNIGTMVRPITPCNYKTTAKPPQIGSHNDQRAYWQSGSTEGFTYGWLGRIADQLLAVDESTYSPFTCVNVSGSSLLLAGRQVLQYNVSSTGVENLIALKGHVYGSSVASQTLVDLISQTDGHHLFAKEHANICARSISSGDLVTDALAATPESSIFPSGAQFTTTLSGNEGLFSSLKMVARIIKARKYLGVKRQFFHVSIGGFDHHSGLLDTHANQISLVSRAMAAFHDWTVYEGIADKVTQFTASDFGRQFVSNGNGTDHGWGSMQLVLGGSVNGGKLHGTPPVYTADTVSSCGQAFPSNLPDGLRYSNANHLSNSGGILVPSMPVQQLGAALARWTGAAQTEAHLLGLFPELNDFRDANGLLQEISLFTSPQSS